MRVALDIRPLQNESGARGVGRYVRELVAGLPAGDETLYLESRWGRPSDLPEGARGTRVPLLRPSRAITLFDQVATPLFCARRRVDLFHSTFYALPLFGSGSTRWVLTVHDLIPLLIPGATSTKNTAIFRKIYESSRAADAVVVPSKRTRDDLMRFLAIRPERIRVIPMGVGRPFASPGAREAPVAGSLAAAPSTEPRATFGPFLPLREAGAAVLIYAGGFNETKNVPFLIETLAAMGAPEGGGSAPVLSLAGEPGSARDALLRAARRAGVERRLHFLGRLSDEELANAYRAADVFVSASRYEGFGLPALEAMACGCPVAALATAAVPEVVEGAALTVDEEDPSELAVAVERLLRGAGLRADLVAKGRARAAELSWERTASTTHALYRELTGKAERAA